MKRRKTLVVTIFSTALIFLSVNLFAQSGSVNQNQNKEKKQIQSQEQIKNQLKLQDKNQFQNKIHGNHFIDLNNDGFNDNAPDIDGDGIPNGQDPDYTRPLNGKGSKFMGDRNGYGYENKNSFANGNCNGTGNGSNGTNQIGNKRGGRR
ncbi:MAG: hypothetical protein EHM47_10235 [Ignavibacteriales bacterium]|nr:MAG: hypothetical protein EHM47_10235 [Ignavibacteriales bacterium]